MGILITATPSSQLSAACFTAEPHAPPCPICHSQESRVIGHDGIHEAITLCGCNTCFNEWSETVSGDEREKRNAVNV